MQLKDYRQAPQQPGCYILSLCGVPKYVGRATDMTGTVMGLRRRLWQHHNGNASNPNIQEHKDVLTVEYYPTKSSCEAHCLESKLIEKYNTFHPNGWNRSRPTVGAAPNEAPSPRNRP